MKKSEIALQISPLDGGTNTQVTSRQYCPAAIPAGSRSITCRNSGREAASIHAIARPATI